MTKGMRKYFKKKIFWFVITLVAAVILNFILPRLMPGDPVNAIVGKNVSPGATPEQIQEQIAFYKHQFGLDKNIFGQFWDFIKNAVSGTFGVSYNQYPRLVSDIIGSGIWWTVALQLPAILVGWLLGNLLGALAAYKRSFWDKALMPVSLFFSAIPAFGAAVILLVIFAVTLGVAPVNGAYDPGMMQLAFVLGFLGFGAKAAVFPLHEWLPTASVAPTPVTALLHAVAVVNSGVFAVMRMTYYVYGVDFLKGTPAQALCLTLSIFSLLFGAAQAIRERHFKRRLAYSTMSNLSYMLLGAMTMTPQGLKAGLAHMLFHGIVKICLFMCAGAFMKQTRRSYIYEINGVGRRMPANFTTYTLGALSLTGIPLFCGFVSKWQLLRACLGGAQEAAGIKAAGAAQAAGNWVSFILPELMYAGTAALIISAFMCAIYTISISVRAFFPMDAKDLYKDSNVTDAGPLTRIPIGVFTAANIIFGVFPGPILAILTAIGEGRL